MQWGNKTQLYLRNLSLLLLNLIRLINQNLVCFRTNNLVKLNSLHGEDLPSSNWPGSPGGPGLPSPTYKSSFHCGDQAASPDKVVNMGGNCSQHVLVCEAFISWDYADGLLS